MEQSDDYVKKCKSNANSIGSEIENLSLGHWSWGERVYKDYWAHVKQINELFKTTKPLFKDDRERLWNKFCELNNKTRLEQEKESESKKYNSLIFYNDIMSLIREAKVCTFFGLDFPDADELKRLGSLLFKAGKKLTENKQQMIAIHKQECFNEIKEVREQHDIWWESLHKYKQQKKEDFYYKVKENIEKNLAKLRKANDNLDNMKDSRDKLQNDIDNAWNDRWRDSAYERLAEKERIISEIENYIDKLEAWIAEDNAKI